MSEILTQCTRCGKTIEKFFGKHDCICPFPTPPAPLAASGDPGPWCAKCHNKPCLCYKPESVLMVADVDATIENPTADSRLKPQADAVREFYCRPREGEYDEGFCVEINIGRIEPKHATDIHVIERSAYESKVRELAEWKAKYIEARKSGYAEGLEEERARSAKLVEALKLIAAPWTSDDGSCSAEKFYETVARDAIREWEGSK